MSKPSREYLYGINPIFEAVRGRRRTLYEAYINRATANQPRLAKLCSFLEQRKVPVEQVDKSRIFELCRSKEHQGAVLKVSPYPYVPSDELWGQERLLLLDNVEDPNNVGGIIRSADIFGFHAVLLPTKGVPDIYPSIVKVSAGATEHLRMAKDASANQYMKRAKEEGFRVVALDAKGTVDIADAVPAGSGRLFLVIGGEDKSVGQFILNNADAVARIPQHGKINSLNASVAAGIAMYELSRR